MVCPWASAFRAHWPNKDATQFTKSDKVQVSFSNVPSALHCQSSWLHIALRPWTPWPVCRHPHSLEQVHHSVAELRFLCEGLCCSLLLHPPLRKGLFWMPILGPLSRSPSSGLVGVSQSSRSSALGPHRSMCWPPESSNVMGLGPFLTTPGR